MSQDLNKGNPGQIPGLDLGNVVAEVASAFVEAINLGRPASGSLHRNLKISLVHLIAEIKSVEVVQALVCQTSLQTHLQQIAQCLNAILCDDYVKAQYRHSLGEEARRRTPRLTQLIAFFVGHNEDSSPSALIDKWSRYPLPILGMFRELVCRSGLRGLDIKKFMRDDDHLFRKLTALVKEWNSLVDQIYDGNYTDNRSDVSDANWSRPPETLLRGEDSVNELSQFLYDILHKTWPCQSQSHDHDGRLGLCQEAKFYLDPQWSEKAQDHDGFFILLAGPEILQECRIYVNKLGRMEADIAACLVSHDDESRAVCLHLMSDGNNQLWDQRRSARPLELIVAEDEHVDISLSQLLMTVKPTYTAKRVMGVTLARCILHLFEGSWVNDSLSVDDIYVYCKMQNDLPHPLFHRIFIATKFDVDHDDSRTQSGAYRIHPFPTILALGIVLLELELGEDLPEIKDQLPFSLYAKTRNPFYLAQHLLREFRARYNLDSGLLRAVEFCIDRKSFSQFATRTPEAQVSNHEFVNTYYNEIVRPLERDLVKGAHWTWPQAAQLKHPSLAHPGICRILNKRSLPTHKASAGLKNNQTQLRDQTTVAGTTLESRKDTHLDSLRRPSPEMSPSSLKHQAQSNHSTPNGSSLHEPPIVSPTAPSKPRSRDDFEVAIICALQTEANAVQAMFDKHWDEDSIYQYKKQANDPNSYSAGLIGNHNVVLAHQPRMGKVTAANVAAACSMSFTKLKLALIVGICGGVPAPESSEDILLGDVVFSKGIVQYDFGRRYPDRFRRKIAVDDQLGRPNREISSLLAKLETTIHRQRLQTTIANYLDERDHRTGKDIKPLYPGPAQDKLFQATYNHKHQEKARYCVQCVEEICDEALSSTCEELKCDRRRFVRRLRKNEKNRPVLHFGLIASGDTVLKSGTDRDEIAREAKAIAFEMEGSGVWDTIPCVVVKGVCDYADSHKNKVWQDYAAMTAAASAKAFLRHWSANE